MAWFLQLHGQGDISTVFLCIPHLLSVCSDGGEEPGPKSASLGRTDTVGGNSRKSAALLCETPALAGEPAIFSWVVGVASDGTVYWAQALSVAPRMLMLASYSAIKIEYMEKNFRLSLSIHSFFDFSHLFNHSQPSTFILSSQHTY